MKFGATSTAGNATVTNNAEILFQGSSTAGNATFTNAFGIVIFRWHTHRGQCYLYQRWRHSQRDRWRIHGLSSGLDRGQRHLDQQRRHGQWRIQGRNLFEGDAGNATLIANGGSNGGEGGFI